MQAPLLGLAKSIYYKKNSSVIDQRTSKCGKNISDTLARTYVPLFCSYHILTSSVIYNWTDAQQLGVYLLII